MAFQPTVGAECSGTADFSSEAQRCDYIMDALVSLYWLQVREHIQHKIVLLTYRVLHGMTLSYLGPFVRAVDLPSRRALRSASTSHLVVPTFKHSAVAGRTFQVSGSLMWNELPKDIATAPSLPVFRRLCLHPIKVPTR